MQAKYLSILLVILLSISTFSTVANEKIPANETTVFNETFSWQAMANISAIYNPSLLKGQDQEDPFDYLGVSLLLDVYYKGFFATVFYNLIVIVPILWEDALFSSEFISFLANTDSNKDGSFSVFKEFCLFNEAIYFDVFQSTHNANFLMLKLSSRVHLIAFKN